MFRISIRSSALDPMAMASPAGILINSFWRTRIDQLIRFCGGILGRQAVLADMRDAGEPTFETDFPPGSDMIGEILGGPWVRT